MKLSRSKFISALTLSLTMIAGINTAHAGHSLSLPYANWTYPASFTKLEADLKVISDPGEKTASGADTGWFLSHQFSFKDSTGANNGGGYIGLQTNQAPSGKKGVMFSLWNATSATAGSGSTCQSFSGEGVGMQCFQPYSWVAGKTYRLRVVNNGSAYSGYVVDMSTATPTETYIGQIQAPSGSNGFGNWSVQWAEHYAVAPANCADLPYLKALWSRPVGNGGSVLPGATTVNYGTGAYCHNSAVIANGTDNYLEAGNPGASSEQNLMTSLNKYVYAATTADGCGGGGLKPDSAAINTCSKLTRVILPGGKIALQTEDGYYLTCTGGGGSTVTATARTVGNNESFTETITSGKVSYKSYGGKYLTAVNYGTVDFKCNALYASTNENFTPVLNKARSASVTVSSENTTYGQLGTKAIDGGPDGYPGDVTREWATNGQGAGAWIQLNWSAKTAIKQIILYDRPNTNDQITGGTLSFSDGSKVTVGALPNDGSGLSVTFTSKSINWVKFTVDQVSSTTASVGLAEFEAY
ncbi:MAG: DUF7402 domain-containing protein [Burkholderiaceae bacterium]